MGAKIARDGNDAVVLADRVVSIAAKAGSYLRDAGDAVPCSSGRQAASQALRYI